MKNFEYKPEEYEDYPIINVSNIPEINLLNTNVEETEEEPKELPVVEKVDLFAGIKEQRKQEEERLKKLNPVDNIVGTSPLIKNYKPIKGTATYEIAKEKYLAKNPQDRADLELLTRLAGQESGFNFAAENKRTKALGVFQLMPMHFGKYTREQIINNPELQFKLSVQLLRNQRAAFNKNDYEQAAKKGISNADMDALA